MINKHFWKAYGLTLLQIVVVTVISYLVFLILVKNMDSVYPFFESLQQMQQNGIVTTDLVSNIPLFGNFVFALITIILLYTILLSGVLSIFDILIQNQLLNKIFSLKQWLFEWFRYSCVSLLLVIFLYVALVYLNSVILLTLLIFLAICVFCYGIILMQFKLSLKKTLLRLLVLLMSYFVFIFVVVLLFWLLKWYGVFISLLLITFLLLWSKIYLLRKL